MEEEHAQNINPSTLALRRNKSNIWEKKPNLEEMLTKFMSVSETRFQNIETALKNQQASIQGLKTQIGSLPSNTEPNPKEHVKAVTLRSGKVLTESEKKPPQEADRKEVEPENNDNLMPKEYKPPIQYPAKSKKDCMDA
ncbi:hypothetical protein GOBAR_AA34752 [Gossypium barbadense]|uniref:Uncharacterized protein n=1 Tax=Gossypium barbadense TaxID=3634 RepID=A0A2P5W4C9_GOSBA|nr:hypothetical protein GOBAR_AA34752 [Gossypium barbadense]